MQKRNPAKNKVDVLSVTAEDTLLNFLLAELSHKPRNVIKKILKERQVLVAGKPISQFDHPLVPGQKVEVHWEPAPIAASTKAGKGVNIIHEDSDIIVVEKPAGLLTVATDKEKRKTAYAELSAYVKTQDPDNKIFIVHRLDRETSGLLLFAKNEKIKLQIQETWETTIAERAYIAVVEGEVKPPSGTITSWLTESKALKVYSSQNPNAGKKAITHYKTLRGNEHFSLLQLNLETGRKHQIRVHLQEIGHPVVGDVKYGSREKTLRRMALHAQILAFVHPKTGKLCRYQTPIPKEFMRLVTRQPVVKDNQ